MHNRKEICLLLADDDPDDLELFQDALDDMSLGVKLDHCENGIALMQQLKTSQPADLPDMIFLDLNMPQKTGFECIKEIRKEESLKDIPVVIFSTSFEPEIVKSLHQDGADRYIVKPNNFRDLKTVIRTVLDLGKETRLRSAAANEFVLQP